MIVFGEPRAFLGLLIILFIVLLGWWGWRVKKKNLKLLLDQKFGRQSQIKKYLLAGTMLTLAIIALAGPKIAFPYIPKEISQIKTGQIIFLVDVSESMAARATLDSPSRLERAKTILSEIVEAFPEAEISLYAFTSKAWSLTPFVKKEDFNYLRSSIRNSLEILCVPGSGSDIGYALSEVLDQFSNQTQSKIIVLLTDGEYFGSYQGRGITPSQRSTLEASLKKALEKNVKVIPVGIGEIEGAPIPFFDEKGNFLGYGLWRGEIYVSYLDELLLKAIASRCSSEYFSERDIPALISYIEGFLVTVSEPSTEPEAKEYEYQDVNYYLFLIPIAILFVALARYYFK